MPIALNAKFANRKRSVFFNMISILLLLRRRGWCVAKVYMFVDNSNLNLKGNMFVSEVTENYYAFLRGCATDTSVGDLCLFH